MQVGNKRGVVPPQFGFLPDLNMTADVRLDGRSIAVEPHDKSRSTDFVRSLLDRGNGSLWLPIPTVINKKLMSRFIGKVAVEALAHRFLNIEGWRGEILRQEALEPLRQYVRVGDHPKIWQFTRRPLYPPQMCFETSTYAYQILHEFAFLYTDERELIFVLALFGEEFAINMSNPDPVRYVEYLKSRNGESILAPWD